MNNKKGFTLVELLAVIVLLGLIISIGVPGVMKISEKMKSKSLNTKIDIVESAAVLWGQDNKTLLQAEPKEECYYEKDSNNMYSCNKISVEKLIEEDFLDGDSNGKSFINPKNNKDLASDEDCKVHVYKKNNRVYAYFGTETCKSLE